MSQFVSSSLCKTIWIIVLAVGWEAYSVSGYVDLLWRYTDVPTPRVYKQVSLSGSNLTSDLLKGDFTADTILTCANYANRINGSHLMCYQDQQCLLYDIKVSSDHEETETDAVDHCYTDIVDACYTDTEIVPEGATFMDPDTCATKVCEKGLLISPVIDLPSTTCNAPFEFVPEVGCIYIIETQGGVGYPQSETMCAQFGARLVIPGNFEALRKYMQCKADLYSWVGVNPNTLKWNDGSDVTDDTWGPNEPMASNECAIAKHDKGSYLFSTPCDWGNAPICQIP